jgi:hypothetical protein
MLRRKIRSQNRNKRNRNLHYTDPQIGKSIQLRSEVVRRRITYEASIFGNYTTSIYSLSGGSDIRFLSYSTILGASEFTNTALLYKNYKIKALSVTLCPVSVFAQTSSIVYYVFPMLYISTDPDNTSASNPTNNTIGFSDTAGIFSPLDPQVRQKSWNLAGISNNTDIWLPVAQVSSVPGQVYFGSKSIYSSTGTTTNTLVFDVRFELIVDFCNP